jgi:hypothetical protein
MICQHGIKKSLSSIPASSHRTLRFDVTRTADTQSGSLEWMASEEARQENVGSNPTYWGKKFRVGISACTIQKVSEKNWRKILASVWSIWSIQYDVLKICSTYLESEIRRIKKFRAHRRWWVFVLKNYISRKDRSNKSVKLAATFYCKYSKVMDLLLFHLLANHM